MVKVERAGSYSWAVRKDNQTQIVAHNILSAVDWAESLAALDGSEVFMDAHTRYEYERAVDAMRTFWGLTN